MLARWPSHRCTRSALALGRLLTLLLGLTQCREQPELALLRVDAVTPAEAQFGDELTIVGDGFALGSPASVSVRGVVYRAGQPPGRVEHSFRAQTESQRELTLPLPRHAERTFCGEPEQAAHATFRGDVEVAIAARAAGAPPATGTLRGAVIELYPAVKTRGAEDRRVALGREIVGFLGVEVAGAREGGLEVTDVAPGSRAASADLRPGDRVLRAGGVTVLQPSDLIPDASRTLELAVVRGGLELLLPVDVDGFTPQPPRQLGWVALPIFVASLWFSMRLSPLSRLLRWLGQNWLEQERARRRAVGRTSSRGGRGPEWPRALELVGGASGLFVWLGVAAALSAPLLRRVPVDVTLGLSFAMSVSAALLVAFAFAAGDEARRRWSLAGALGAAFLQWVALLPAAIAVVVMAVSMGSDLDEVVRSQGPWPWQWNAFQGLGPLLACGVLLLTCLPRPGRPAWRLVHARPPRLSWRSDGDGWFDRLYLCSTCALATVVFLGGGAWLGADRASATLLTAVGSALVLVTKYTLLVVGISFVRGLCLGVSPEQWSRLGARWFLPASVAALVVALGWRALGRSSAFFAWVERGFAPASLALVVLGLGFAALRARAAAREAAPPSLCPWL